MFKISLENVELAKRVKTIIGIPEPFLNDETIISPEFKNKSEIYINNFLKEIKDIVIENETQNLINMSAIYYIAYLLCVSMPIRLPSRMENISTKTLLQTIDWYKFSDEMLGRCDDLLNKILEDEGIEISYGSTIIALSDETTYPNTTI